MATHDDRPPALRLFTPSTWTSGRELASILRTETVGGMLLLLGATVALAWANSPWSDSYARVRDARVGPESLDLGFAEFHLGLTVGQWAADLLLAVFFFVVGVELKNEFVQGDLRDPRRAAVPIAAAVCGVIVPALVYLAFTFDDPVANNGWAIPTATDIAFALAVLAVIGSHLPTALRAFLLTLAVVDDLIAITIIAIFYSSDVEPLWLLAALVPIVLFTLVARLPRRWWPLLVPLALLAWLAVHEAGIHATVAGVVLGLSLPVRHRMVDGRKRDAPGITIEHWLRPFSAGIAVPVFALFAAGVTLTGGGLGEAVRDVVFVATLAGLVVGKVIGVAGGAYLTARFTRAQIDDELAWIDVVGLALLAGIGFTVSLLIGELAFGTGGVRDDHVRVAVLGGSLLSAILATIVLRLRNRHYREMHLLDTADALIEGVVAGTDARRR